MNETFSVTAEDYTISATITQIGPDVLIVVTGGDHPHIGDVTTLTATTPVQTVRYPSHDGRFHKDDYVSDRIVNHVQPVLTGSCTVTAGIHVDQITQAQINAAGPMGDQLGAQIATWLREHPVETTAPAYYRDDEQPK
ncbi:amino acid decarboxylase [Furfurilactobacillus sp. WILCCON 0119]|uniref:prenylated flavin chaperone LpdD n=1 Tax=Furfurilactobacillus entadae TaxID=2922307 RepID=UPI0035E7893E